MKDTTELDDEYDEYGEQINTTVDLMTWWDNV